MWYFICCICGGIVCDRYLNLGVKRQCDFYVVCNFINIYFNIDVVYNGKSEFICIRYDCIFKSINFNKQLQSEILVFYESGG